MRAALEPCPEPGAREADALHLRARRQPSRSSAPASATLSGLPGCPLTSTVQSRAGRPSRRLREPALHAGLSSGLSFGAFDPTGLLGGGVGDLCQIEAWDWKQRPSPSLSLKGICQRNVGQLRLRGKAEQALGRQQPGGSEDRGGRSPRTWGQQ